MKLLKTVVLLLAATLLLLPSSSQAADESAEVALNMKANSGSSLFKQAARSVSWKLNLKISVPPSSPRITPLKTVRLKFPQQMRFAPGNLPACTDQQFNNRDNLAAGPEAIAKLCPRSVIGNGTATIFIAGVNNPLAEVKDPQLIIFYAGRKNGNPAIKIYAFSKTTNVGTYMTGVLNKAKQMVIQIPVLSNDSAVSNLEMNIPGQNATNPLFRGKKRNFVQATCATGKWSFAIDMTLGTRAYPSGTPISSNSYLYPSSQSDCFGANGKPGLTRPTVRGPRAVKRRGIYRVTVRNNATAVARKVTIRVQGRARALRRLGNLRPGASKTVRFNLRIKGKKNQRARVVFVAQANKVKAKRVVRMIRLR